MMLAEKNDPKEELREKSMAYKSALEQDVKVLKDRTSEALTNVLIITGALGVSYLVYRSFFTSRKKSKRRKALLASDDADDVVEHESRLGAMLTSAGTVLATQAASFLLAIAREKLIEYLNKDSGEPKVD